MRASAVLLLFAACSCAIDDREVTVADACVKPLPDGRVLDFATATVSNCPAGFCTADVIKNGQAVLFKGAHSGLVFPYSANTVEPVSLGLVTPSDDATSEPALWALIRTDAAPTNAPDGFALRFVSCVDTSGYSAASFTTDVTNGDLGSCPLRFSLQFGDGTSGPIVPPSPLDETFGADPIPVDVGITSVSLPMDRGQRTRPITGMQWEFTVPLGDGAGCSAYFTLDDVRLE